MSENPSIISYLTMDINKLSKIEDRINRHLQPKPDELTLSDEYKFNHINDNLKRFCSQNHIDLKKFIECEGHIWK